MEDTNVYYSENSEITEESCWNIETSDIVENDNLTWQEDCPEITVSYSENREGNDQTNTDNDGYLTANAETSIDTDQTQYYSLLESACQSEDEDCNTDSDTYNTKIFVKVNNETESILPDHSNDDLRSEYVNQEDDENNSSNQVLLYHTDDPNEMYAIQIADDGSGNLQRYKYKVRQTADGQLEAVPGTIELQSTNDFVEKESAPEEIIEKIIQIKQEVNYASQENQYPTEENQYHMEENQLASEENQIPSEGNIEDEENIPEEEFESTEYLDEEFGTPEYLLDNSDDNYCDQVEYLDQNMVTTSRDSENFQSGIPKDFNTSAFVKTCLSDSEDGNVSETDYDEANSFMLNELQKKVNEERLASNSVNLSTNILQHNFFKTNVNNSSQIHDRKHATETLENSNVFKDDKTPSFLFVNTKEKENVSVSSIKCTLQIKNSRSLLKSNFISSPIEEQKKTVCNKKFSMIRMLNNNKATHTKDREVLKTPECNQDIKKQDKCLVKSVRQPRKQTITPVERVGSEIIVQPLYYTYNNQCTGSIPLPLKRKYTVTHEILKVSDESDPDYTEKARPKKKKKYNRTKQIKEKKITEITISDSDLSSSEESVIEVLSDQEKENTKKKVSEESDTIFDAEIIPVESVENSDGDLDKCDDIMKIQEAVDDIINEREKTEKNLSKLAQKNDLVSEEQVAKLNKKNSIKCPICPKTFPRYVNLKTHMNVHSARRELRSKTVDSPQRKKIQRYSINIKKSTSSPGSASKKSTVFQCVKCNLRFLSQSQFARHQTIHVKPTLRSNVLTPRKRPLVKSSNMISPRKLRLPANKLKNSSTKLNKTPFDNKKALKPTRETFKCDFCGKIFSQRTLLNSHRAMHKTLSCLNCNMKFTSKLSLEDHQRKYCVKSPVLSHMRQSSIRNKLSKRSMFKCEICNKTFALFTDLLEHKTLAHKKKVISNTKSVPQTITKPKKAHGGVPASLKLQKAFDIMKLKS